MFGFRSVILLVACASVVIPAQLKPATLSAWDDYVQAAEARLHSNEAKQVVWMDRIPGQRERLQNGEIVVSPANRKPSCAIPHGLIHDWIGAVFIPKVSISDVWDVLDDYDRYTKYYGPTIRRANLLSRDGDRESFRVLYVRKALFVTASLDVEYEAHSCRLDQHRLYSVARSTSVHEIHNFGEPGEHTLPPDDGSGYLWRAFSILRLDESDGGVYVEQESIALSRNIPASLRWLVEPFVERLSRELTIGWLRQTRNAAVAAAR